MSVFSLIIPITSHIGSLVISAVSITQTILLYLAGPEILSAYSSNIFLETLHCWPNNIQQLHNSLPDDRIVWTKNESFYSNARSPGLFSYVWLAFYRQSCKTDDYHPARLYSFCLSMLHGLEVGNFILALDLTDSGRFKTWSILWSIKAFFYMCIIWGKACVHIALVSGAAITRVDPVGTSTLQSSRPIKDTIQSNTEGADQRTPSIRF
jgi:hypothetical protein